MGISLGFVYRCFRLWCGTPGPSGLFVLFLAFFLSHYVNIAVLCVLRVVDELDAVFVVVHFLGRGRVLEFQDLASTAPTVA